ncbi:hypothetical protein [Nakamurella sp. PAMC28650]|uniref:hypothetical protein n=1 Tax=Nakamurella sp. PAMC28650 TaxID=2762325 RepID=UPI00164E05F8|nr:hypothetical protein [Nakamurella sp. PAMC28650]QNK82574.1 hypothetical protein H7F38_07670 [Nakamurella sp. PAMC28650]
MDCDEYIDENWTVQCHANPEFIGLSRGSNYWLYCRKHANRATDYEVMSPFVRLIGHGYWLSCDKVMGARIMKEDGEEELDVLHAFIVTEQQVLSLVTLELWFIFPH